MRFIRKAPHIVRPPFAGEPPGQFPELPDHVGLIGITAGVGEVGKVSESAGTKGCDKVSETDKTGQTLRRNPQMIEKKPFQAPDVEAEFVGKFIDLEIAAMAF